MASCARRLRGAVDAMAESIDRILDTIEVEQQVSRLGQLIALQRQALEAHGFQDFADFQSCSQASSSPQDLAALQRLQASERRWRELLQRLEATAGRAVGGIACLSLVPPQPHPRTWGFRKSFQGVWSPEALRFYSDETLKGHQLHPSHGQDVHQMGGDVLLDQQGVVVFRHYSQTSQDGTNADDFRPFAPGNLATPRLAPCV
eukprot:g26411.t1